MPTFTVTGMSCEHCVHAVTDAVHGVDPAAHVAVDLPAGRVSVTDSHAEPAAIAAAIEDEGYQAALLTP